MQNIDWSLLIGFPLAEAEEYLKEEGAEYKLIPTTSPKAHRNSSVVDEIDEEDEICELSL